MIRISRQVAVASDDIIIILVVIVLLTVEFALLKMMTVSKVLKNFHCELIASSEGVLRRSVREAAIGVHSNFCEVLSVLIEIHLIIIRVATSEVSTYHLHLSTSQTLDLKRVVAVSVSTASIIVSTSSLIVLIVAHVLEDLHSHSILVIECVLRCCVGEATIAI